jgi:hypothetical protein
LDDKVMDSNLGMSRRTLIKRGAIVGGSVLWAGPVVQSFSQSALAVTGNGTPACFFDVILKSGGICLKVGRCTAPLECCTCLEGGGDDRCDEHCTGTDCVSLPVQVVACP